MTNNKVQRLAIIAISTAFLAVASQLTIPLPLVPLTLQTLAVGIIATLLKPLDSILAICLYLVLGAIGVPVFCRWCCWFWCHPWTNRWLLDWLLAPIPTSFTIGSNSFHGEKHTRQTHFI